VPANVLEGLERLRLASAAVQRHHQVFPEPLTQRMGADESLEEFHTFDVVPQLEVGRHAVLRDGKPKLRESFPLGGGGVLVGEVDKCLSPPQGEGLVEYPGRVGWQAGLHAGSTAGRKAVEAQDVHRVGGDVQEVAGGPGHDRMLTGASGRPEGSS